MVNTKTETLIRISDAAKHFPTRPHVGSVWRWVLHGVRGVRLDSALVGGQRFTSQEAIERFIRATTAAGDHHVDDVPQKGKAREAAIAAAEREFDSD